MTRKRSKMTRAQAAAARREIPEPQTNIDPEHLGKSTVVVDKGKLMQFLWPVALVAVMVLVSYIWLGAA